MASKITPHEDPHDGFRVTLDPNQAPIPAEIVSDRRNTMAVRLSVVGVVGLILFFLISAYIQSVRNGRHHLPTPVVTVTLAPASPTPVVQVSPSPVPTTIIVTSPLPVVTFAPGPRASNTTRPSQAPPGSPRPTRKPSASPSPTCLLPAPAPCVGKIL